MLWLLYMLLRKVYKHVFLKFFLGELPLLVCFVILVQQTEGFIIQPKP